MKRYRQRRTKGFRLPSGVKSVARPSRWGNPYQIVRDDSDERSGWWVDPLPEDGPNLSMFFNDLDKARDFVVQCYRRYMRLMTATKRDEFLRPLRDCLGLGCYCPLDSPCHADVIIEVLTSD